MSHPLPRIHRVAIGLIGLGLLAFGAVAARAGAAGTSVGTVNASRLIRGMEARVALWVSRDQVIAAHEAAEAALDRVENALLDAPGDAGLAATAAIWTRDTDGAYDPAALPLYQLWESCRAVGRVPRENEIAAARGDGATGYGLVAAGWAADLASQELRASGFGDHLVAVGPIEVVSGARGGRPWRLAVEHPAGTGLLALGVQRPGALIRLYHDAEFFLPDGCAFAGLLDPRSGRPVHGTAFVLAFAPRAADAAALAAAVPVLGPSEGMRLASTAPGCELIAVGADGAVHASAGINLRDGMLEWKP